MMPLDVTAWWLSLSGYGSVWLLNYLIHSTLLLGGVWLFVRVGRPPQAFRDVLWKVALVGGVVTATFQITGWGGQPLGGSWTVPTGQVAVVPAIDVSAPFLSAEEARTPAVSATSSGALWQRVRTGAALGWPQFLMGIWGIGAVLCGARLFLTRRRLDRSLHPRTEITEGPARDLLNHLCRAEKVRRRIRLTTSSRIGGPVALGRGEICLPLRALNDLDREQLYHVLAHELAHLLRGDPIWRWVSAGMEGTFFFQPLNRMARRRLNETAEFLCDDWTVARTGEGVTLAKCLVEVAVWLRPFSRIPAAGMAERGSSLVQRVERLLSGGTYRGGPTRGSAGAAVVLLGVLVTVSPGFVPYSPTPSMPLSPILDEILVSELAHPSPAPLLSPPRPSRSPVWIQKQIDVPDPVFHLRELPHVPHEAPVVETRTRLHRKIRTLARKKMEATRAVRLEIQSQDSRFTIQVDPQLLLHLEHHLQQERELAPILIQARQDHRRLLEEAQQLLQELLRQQEEQELHKVRLYRI